VAARRVAARSVFALVLLGFVLVTTGVIARRAYGVRQVRALRALKQQRDALEAERVRLDAAIRAASSRARIVPIAEQRLNMHIATPEQLIYLPPPAAPPTQPSRGTPPLHDSH
jgi:cell division protein FtsL